MENLSREEYLKKLVYDIVDGCFIAAGYSRNQDYPSASLFGIKHTSLSRVVWMMDNQKRIPKGMVIRHTCDNPGCINPDHLLIGTHADNVADRVARDRSACGEDNGRAKLTKRKVRKIYRNEELNYTQLAKRYGVDRMIVSKIKRGILWERETRDLRSAA